MPLLVPLLLPLLLMLHTTTVSSVLQGHPVHNAACTSSSMLSRRLCRDFHLPPCPCFCPLTHCTCTTTCACCMLLLLLTRQLPTHAQLPARCTQLAWAHPQYGPCLAVGSSEGSVHIIQGPAPWAGQGSRTQQQNGHPNHPGWQQRQRSSDGWSCTARLPCGQEAVR